MWIGFGRPRMYVEIWWINLCENVHLEDCREAGKIILTWVFIYVMRMGGSWKSDGELLY
jgi:hypothetical protein